MPEGDGVDSGHNVTFEEGISAVNLGGIASATGRLSHLQEETGGYRSCSWDSSGDRSIPSSSIFRYREDLLSPRMEAAFLLSYPTSSRADRIEVFSNSFTDCLRSSRPIRSGFRFDPWSSAGRSSVPIISRSQKIMDRSTAFFNSRTLPLQSWSSNSFMVA